LAKGDGTDGACGITAYAGQTIDQYVELTGKFTVEVIDNLMRKDERLSQNIC
jgi:hydroxyethylthiazole kinase-like sugar kinase family protein